MIAPNLCEGPHMSGLAPQLEGGSPLGIFGQDLARKGAYIAKDC